MLYYFTSFFFYSSSFSSSCCSSSSSSSSYSSIMIYTYTTQSSPFTSTTSLQFSPATFPPFTLLTTSLFLAYLITSRHQLTLGDPLPAKQARLTPRTRTRTRTHTDGKVVLFHVTLIKENEKKV